jgi:hypothetical protein
LGKPIPTTLLHAALLLIERLRRAFPIEFAELKSSAKQRRFARAFFSRRHPETGRKVSIFVALGANRSGKSFTAGVMCFAKYLRDHARDGDWFWCVGQNAGSIGRRPAAGAVEGAAQADVRRADLGPEDRLRRPPQDRPAHQRRRRCLVEFRSADQKPSTFEQAKLTACGATSGCPRRSTTACWPASSTATAGFSTATSPSSSGSTSG